LCGLLSRFVEHPTTVTTPPSAIRPERHVAIRRLSPVGEPSPPTVNPGKPSRGTQKPEPITDGSLTRILRLEANEFPIESLFQDILRVDKFLVGHHLIVVHATR
jgi:hypothetical protein